MIVESQEIHVYMAGDIVTAKRWLRKHAYRQGTCVTVTPTDFVYTGGEEAGFIVGLVNYPRFPKSLSVLTEQAREIARALVVECCQRTALVVGPQETEWIVIEPPGAK